MRVSIQWKNNNNVWKIKQKYLYIYSEEGGQIIIVTRKKVLSQCQFKY